VRGLNAGFRDALTDQQIADLRGANYNLVRSEIGDTRAPGMWLLNVVILDNAASVIAQLSRLSPGCFIEAGNEPNIGCDKQPKLSPAQYVALAGLVRDWAAVNAATVYYGAVSNCNREGLGWLQRALDLAPWMTHVSVHRYQYGGGAPNVRASEWGDRSQEHRALAVTLNGRHLLVTEAGCKNTYTAKFLFWKWQKPINERDQLAYIQADRACWSGFPNFDGYVLYQHWTGNPPTDAYGLRGPTWAPKLGFYAFKGTL
jgi:hypothetical protein